MSKKVIIIGICIVVVIAILAWAFVESTKPLPGVETLQDSRNHIPEGSQTNYKFNPPTSGDHYPSWITKGFYDLPRADGNLVHSQEHGYVILWYDCELSSKVQAHSLIPEAFAQTINMTSGSEGSASATLESMPKSFSDGSCDSFKNKLKDIYNKFGPHKLIAVPRAGMDSPLILTAWGRTEKFDSLDEAKIKDFIDAYRDHGPEQTDEP